MLSNFSHIYFIGIGGIGMSNLARYFMKKGKQVSGYDKTATDLTNELIHEGIPVHFSDDWTLIEPSFLNKIKTLIVRTPAVPDDLGELQYFIKNGFTIKKRSEVLGLISANSNALCIAGTHGKTTCSMMTAHLLRQSKVDCNAFLGGISCNYNTNLLLSEASDLTVVEADEYDRSFHRLTPWMAVITSVDPDHLDIYGTHEAYLESFAYFTQLIRPGGTLVIKKNVPLIPRVTDGVTVYSYSADEPADFYADNVQFEPGRLFFDFHKPDGVLKKVELGVPVRINVENAVAAMAIASLNSVSDEELKRGIASFKGTKRRFEIQVSRPDFVYIDDYAHHPEELKASITSIKQLFPGKQITGVFQPHLYSRTRDFADEFAQALSLLDGLILLPVYPARELPIPGVSAQVILDKVTIKNKSMSTLEEVFQVIVKKQPEVLVTLGAGNIDTLVPLLKKQFEA
jgi:UDP-N-acetylmuramate--alanine ligase